MGFFKRRKVEPEDDYLDELEITGFSPEKVNLAAEPLKTETLEQKKQAVENACDRINNANIRIKELKPEYQAVNSYLTDIQLIEDMPETNSKKVEELAKKIVVIDKDRRDFGRAMKKISSVQFGHMRECEENISEILKTMAEDEKYCESVKTDMKYLEAEKAGLKYEIKVLKERLYLINSASKIGIAAFAVLMIVFLIINYQFKKDTSVYIYLMVGITAIFATVIYLVHNQSVIELQAAELKMNRAIGLLNKIKIKYVNIASRLSYSYEKHGVKSAMQLNQIWGAYITQKKEHEVYNRASARLIEVEDELTTMLKNVGVRDTSVWISQAGAFIDKSQLYELKKTLGDRREKLKKSMDYNMDTIEKAREEIKRIILSDKENSTELMSILDAYEDTMA